MHKTIALERQMVSDMWTDGWVFVYAYFVIFSISPSGSLIVRAGMCKQISSYNINILES